MEARLQRRLLVEVRHHQLGIGVLLDLEDDADVGRRLVAHVEQVRQLARDDDVRDLLDEIGLRHRPWHRRDHQIDAALLLLLDLVLAANAQRAAALFVDLAELDLAVEQLAARREVRPVDVLHQRHVLDLAILRQRDQRLDDLAQVVRRDVRRHADRDAGRAVDQQIWKPRRQHRRLLGRAVVVRAHVDRVEVELAQQLHRRRRETALGVAIGGCFVAVERSEVSRSIDERHAQHPVLRHANHRLVHRRITVRVIATDHGADHGRALAMLCIGTEMLIVQHRVENSALDRLESIAHVGQRARRDHRHGVVQISTACFCFERCVVRARSEPAAVAAAATTRTTRTTVTTIGRTALLRGFRRFGSRLLCHVLRRTLPRL